MTLGAPRVASSPGREEDLMAQARDFNRSEENVGNVLNMEHINLTVPDQQVAALFYVTGLGFTRDPYVDFGTRNMWINAGAQQFHLPKSRAQKWRGHIGVVVPDLDDLARRLVSVSELLAGTQFEWSEKNDHIAVTCPWGNAIRAYAPEAFPGIYLGIAYAQMDVPPGAAEGIAGFYRQVFLAPAEVVDDEEGRRVDVSTGADQRLVYRETADEIGDYDGHHIAIYVADFSSPHEFLIERDLVTEETDQHQYRFQAIVDPDSGETLAELEHEVRSLRHPMYGRNLVNRNAAQSFRNYINGRDAFYPG